MNKDNLAINIVLNMLPLFLKTDMNKLVFEGFDTNFWTYHF